MRDPIFRRRRVKVIIGVLAVGIAVSALVMFGLIHMARTPSGF